MTEPNIHDLARQVAVLEERMNTSYEKLRAEMAGLENRLLLRFVLAVTILGILFRYLPDLPEF